VNRRKHIEIVDRDELTGRSILPKDQLRHGVYYRGRCRNGTIARWDGERGVFWHWRQKFDRIYLESIKYPADEGFFDVFRVLDELPNPKFEIPFPADAFRPDATFTGDAADLIEFEAKLWAKRK
jgi:hypothetical protein